MFKNINLLLTGSVLLLSIFLISGFRKIDSFQASSLIFSKKFSMPVIISYILNLISLVIEIICPIIIIYSLTTKKMNKLMKLSLKILIAYSLISNILYNFPFLGGMNLEMFVKKLSNTGGLILLFKILN
jgi:uncharacterized membrane protein YphA (DoxX/SURF4 family)